MIRLALACCRSRASDGSRVERSWNAVRKGGDGPNDEMELVHHRFVALIVAFRVVFVFLLRLHSDGGEKEAATALNTHYTHDVSGVPGRKWGK